MPRSRRRHHSKSRSRSRSHSHDRDREPKRRKIESYDSPHPRRSVSSEPEAKETNNSNDTQEAPVALKSDTMEIDSDGVKAPLNETTSSVEILSSDSSVLDTSGVDNQTDIENKSANRSIADDQPKTENKSTEVPLLETDKLESADENDQKTSTPESSAHTKLETDETNISVLAVKDLTITPKKVMSPKQVQKKMESEKKRAEKLKERDEREKKRQEERDEREKKRQEDRDEKKRAKDKLKQVKDDQRLKEKELREMKRKEKEEKEDQKRKEKEQEKIRKQQEIDEKNREKQKLEEQKQKAAAAFVNFFVPKKLDADERKKEDTISCSSFMPFEIKSDMRLAPLNRRILAVDDKEYVVRILETQDESLLYLDELKNGKILGKDVKTWEHDDGSDDVTVLDDLGESIMEQKPKMKVKFLKFHENQRPPYYGTWRKKSNFVGPRKPVGMDSSIFNYEIDSDDEWEDEEDGEDIVGSDDEDKENESENDNDYEVDNDVFVPHGHLSDDEVDGEDEVFDPEVQKAKLKYLKNQFDEEMKSKTAKIKPRVIGCIWYENDKKVDDAINRYLQPLSAICNDTIIIRKRSEFDLLNKKAFRKGLDKEHIPGLLKVLHGNTCKKKLVIVDEYLDSLNKKNISVICNKVGVAMQFKEFAQWRRCPEEGPMYKVPCWYVGEDVQREYNVKLELHK